ncbi:phosphatidate cytidylyltransferase [Gulosibacter molinativorax]|uniref:Phosphatidate cytidylyltransferase n=1 Tax=Gulosibacter molinativorax TaxID=256821 RepID=A0ABT7CC19_9MICO|nr:phosphatidate cytidylyltransferase [Gulosibacter molinativorax]MDJ1372740.1 phosphatidate cytidylyltransferase [Gulosibacter molinativorax]QUY60758.1 Phosphatidate cytidylyltransferase [Gulosibacter molinativorax]
MTEDARDDAKRDAGDTDAPLRGVVGNPGLAGRSLEEEALRIGKRVREINDQVNERSGRNLGSAIAIAFVMIAAVLASLLIDKRWFIILGIAMVAVLVVELSTAMRRVGLRIPRIPSVAMTFAVVPAAFYLGAEWMWAALIAGTIVVLLWRVVEWVLEKPRLSAKQLQVDATAIIFAQLYATFLGSFSALLVAQPNGEYWALAFIIVVVCVDTGAYATGLKFGKHKLAPRISPGKTWEGSIGGTVFAVIAGILLCIYLLGLPWWFGIVMGVAITITATVGDLTESMIKRALGIKDMSNWLPGHGGFWDRLDSMLPSGAMAFALYFWAAPLMH